MKKNIFVALDFNSLDKAIDATNKIKDKIAGVKIGTELYAICGTEGLKKIKELGVEIFLDLKLHDIPNTCVSAINAIKDLRIDYLTIHISSGLKALSFSKKVSGKIKLENVMIDYHNLYNKVLDYPFNADLMSANYLELFEKLLLNKDEIVNSRSNKISEGNLNKFYYRFSRKIKKRKTKKP